jgi:hypothetical protein
MQSQNIFGIRGKVSLYTGIIFITTVLGQEECSASFAVEERATGSHWTGGWVHPRAILDTGG